MAERETDAARGYFLLGAMLGAAVGAAIGLLYAPRPGAQSRHDLAERSEELYGRAREATAGLGHPDDDEAAAADGGADSPGTVPL
jgi:gas vesicle protein